MNGWTGKVLRVDLTNGVVAKEDLNMGWAREYVGMRGLGAKYLYEEMHDPMVDALDPDNVLVLSTGPLNRDGGVGVITLLGGDQEPTDRWDGRVQLGGLLGPRAQVCRV